LDGPKGLAVDTFHAFAFRHLRRNRRSFSLSGARDAYAELRL
jgi:hypothetical protein